MNGWPNIALQPTSSASPPPRLSARTLGVQRVLAAAGAVALLSSLSCRPTDLTNFEEPMEVTRLELHDVQNNVLWRIESAGPRRLSQVDYGVVPTGYRQVIPGGARPRRLQNRERLLLICSMRGGWLRHWGEAVGDRSFRGGVWLAGPWPGTTPAEVFAEGFKSIDRLPEPKTHPPGRS